MNSLTLRTVASESAALFTKLFTVVVIALLVAVGARAGEDNAPSSMGVEQAHHLVAQRADVVILDVRTPAEFAGSHISGAVNLSVEDASFADSAATLDPGKTYIVHCTRNPVDGRSGQAIQAMQKLGFSNVYSLEGGYVAWSEARLPLTEQKSPR